MGKVTTLFTILLISAASLLAAQTQQESLGDVARQLRAQREKDTKKATKVFTNDNLPKPVFGEAVSTMGTPPANHGTPAAANGTPAAPPSSGAQGNEPPESPEDKTKTHDYWQERFKTAREDVAKAKEQQQLSEDELNLLQIQQAREMNPLTKDEITERVQAKQSQVDGNQAATQAAQKALEDLEKEFKGSGAPDDWSQTERPEGQT